MGLFSKSGSTHGDGTVPTRASMRNVLAAVLATDQALNQFCLDFFPEVHDEFTIGMLRGGKFDVLLSRIGTEEILARLKETHAHPQLNHHRPVQRLLKNPLYPELPDLLKHALPVASLSGIKEATSRNEHLIQLGDGCDPLSWATSI